MIFYVLRVMVADCKVLCDEIKEEGSVRWSSVWLSNLVSKRYAVSTFKEVSYVCQNWPLI